MVSFEKIHIPIAEKREESPSERISAWEDLHAQLQQ